MLVNMLVNIHVSIADNISTTYVVSVAEYYVLSLATSRCLDYSSLTPTGLQTNHQRLSSSVAIRTFAS